MRARLAESVFSVAGRSYDWLDVVLWGLVWGDWAELEGEARLGLACVRRVDEDAEADPADPTLVEEAANEFRYARNLLSAEEMEGWLARSGLTAEDWMASMEGAVLRRRWSDEAAETLAAFPPGEPDVEAALWREGICSGRLERAAGEVARRAAAHASLGGEAANVDRALEESVQAELASAGDRLAASALGLRAGDCAERLAHLARLEVALRQFAAEVLTEPAIHAQIDHRGLEWIRLDCAVLSVADEQAAREAAMSVREDGLELAEVARLARAPVREERIYLDETSPEIRERLLSAGRGDLVGPVAVDGAFWLALVRDKVLPTDADPDVRRRAEDELLARLLAREVEARVLWHARGDPR
jgi:hypothetical protein